MIWAMPNHLSGLPNITVDPEVLGGQPTIRGMRIFEAVRCRQRIPASSFRHSP